MKTLLLIDAHAFIHRAFHALPPLTSPTGKPVNAIFGLTNTLIKTLQSEKPDYIAACFDRPEPTFRKKEFDAYKAHRPPLAPELISQLEEARRFFTAFRVPVIEKPGYEADDLIGTLAKTASKKGFRVVILTGDQDTLQLVEDNKILVRTPKKGISEMITYDEKGVFEKLGVTPEQVIDYKGLCGDASDNIPGVPGVGPKTAQKLITEYGNIEEMYERIRKQEAGIKNDNTDKEKSRTLTTLEEKLLNYEKEARLSKKLATIDTDVPLETNVDELIFQNGTHQETLDYLREMGFASIIARLQEGTNKEIRIKTQEKNEETNNKVKQDELFGDGAAENKPKQREVAIPKNVLVINDELVLKDGLFDPKITKVGFDIKALIRDSKLSDALEMSPIFDLHLAAWLLNQSVREWTPDILEIKFLSQEESDGTTTAVKIFKLYNKLKYELEKNELLQVYERFEAPLVDVLAKMERWGIGINKGALEELNADIKKEVKDLEKQITKSAGVSFHLNSPKQVAEILFDKLGLKAEKNTKTPGGERSTAERVLVTLKDQHPIIQKLLEYRESFKIASTYVLPLLELAEQSERIHTRFVQTGTATGRVSSEQPNLQNIPQESKWSTRIRKAFVAERGWSFLSFDYSQLELRLLAHIAHDEAMIEAFKNNLDIHKHTAARIFKVEEADVTAQMRRLAKMLNFGIIYGMGPRRVAEETGLSLTEAKELRANYLNSYPGIERWQKEVLEEVKEKSLVRNINGRLRIFPSIESSNQRYAAEAERQALNFPIQSLEGDALKIATIEAARYFKKEKIYGTKARITLNIHDELLFEIKDDVLESVIPQLKRIMEGVLSLDVPLRVEYRTGKNWGEMAA